MVVGGGGLFVASVVGAVAETVSHSIAIKNIKIIIVVVGLLVLLLLLWLSLLLFSYYYIIAVVVAVGGGAVGLVAVAVGGAVGGGVIPLAVYSHLIYMKLLIFFKFSSSLI